MKLSEAIRLGAMLQPQQRGEMFGTSGTCALGAAAEAIGRLSDWGRSHSYNEWRLQWPLLTQAVSGPAGVSIDDPRLLKKITRLNDGYGWTREQIADWVETIEQAQPQPASEVVAVCPMVEPQMAVVRAKAV